MPQSGSKSSLQSVSGGSPFRGWTSDTEVPRSRASGLSSANTTRYLDLGCQSSSPRLALSFVLPGALRLLRCKSSLQRYIGVGSYMFPPIISCQTKVPHSRRGFFVVFSSIVTAKMQKFLAAWPHFSRVPCPIPLVVFMARRSTV